ncbi:hypothetical protein MMC27_006559 [Xylographa pallens]|nr:hypothetical protein [Xylographa pallens]
MSPAYIVALVVLGEGLPLAEAVEALNLNGSAHKYPPIDGQLFGDMLQRLRDEQPEFYHYVERNSNKTRGKKVRRFLKQGGMVYMEHDWLQKQSLLDVADETLQAAYADFWHDANYGSHSLDRYDF